MPKASFNPDLAKQGGGGVEAGKYRVKSAKTQNIKTDFRPNQLYLVLDLITLDANWQPVREAEQQDMRLSFGQESLKHYRPAVAKNETDLDPVPQSDEPDAEGNTVHMLDSEPFNKSTAAMVFLESLAKQGFPKATLNNAYAPDFAGLEFELASYSPKDCNDKFGMRLNTKPVKDKDDSTKTIDITYKVATKWNNPNYLSGNSSTTSSTSTAATQSTSTGAASVESPEDLTTKVLKLVAERKKGSEIKSMQALFGFVTNEYTKHNPKLPPSQLAAVQSLVKNPEFVAEKFAEIGVTAEYDNDGKPTKFTVPA